MTEFTAERLVDILTPKPETGAYDWINRDSFIALLDHMRNSLDRTISDLRANHWGLLEEYYRTAPKSATRGSIDFIAYIQQKPASAPLVDALLTIRAICIELQRLNNSTGNLIKYEEVEY